VTTVHAHAHIHILQTQARTQSAPPACARRSSTTSSCALTLLDAHVTSSFIRVYAGIVCVFVCGLTGLHGTACPERGKRTDCVRIGTAERHTRMQGGAICECSTPNPRQPFWFSPIYNPSGVRKEDAMSFPLHTNHPTSAASLLGVMPCLR
jgi:hypothetical protein